MPALRRPFFPVHPTTFLLLLAALSVPPAIAADDSEALVLLHKSEDLMRGQGSRGTYRVRIVRPDWQRELRLDSIDDRANGRYRLEMLEPAKVKGTVFLKKGDRLSMYLPKLKREIAISPAMMHDPWMGSDFNNQDLLESGALIDQYDHRIAGRDGDLVTIESTPKPGAPVSWMRIEQQIRSDGLPVAIHFHCQRGERARVLRFEQPRALGGRRIPSRWVMQPLALPERHTLIEIEEIRFDVTPDDSLFTIGSGS